MRLPRFLLNLIPGFEVVDVKEWLKHGRVDIFLKKEKSSEFSCSRCNHTLTVKRGKHRLKVRHLPIFEMEVYLHLWREKGHCKNCKKARSEKLDFLSEETPHLSKEYSWWLGRLCEITSVTQASRFSGVDKSTLMRADFKRLIKMFQTYKIPKVTRISVDEVYARRKKYHPKECRSNQYFTIICDMETGRVIWVSESRNQKALDEFFHVIGKERCNEIKVVAMDQHDPYRASVKVNCPNAEVVWDRFHLMQSFQGALNEERKSIHEREDKGGPLKGLTNGRFKFLFLKKAKDRTKDQQRHIEEVAKENKSFYYLELIKERMIHIFYEKTDEDALWVLAEIEEWITQKNLSCLKGWFKHFIDNWDTIKNWYKYRVTSALSEGQNNVIKSLKRRGYGYRNMAYFKLKILQVCGFLNSKYISINY